jgi:hypothetical protein
MTKGTPGCGWRMTIALLLAVFDRPSKRQGAAAGNGGFGHPFTRIAATIAPR